MVHVILGTGLAETGRLQLRALTLGELVDHLQEQAPWIEDQPVVYYVNGQDARTLEGMDTPVDEEDTVLVATG